MGNGKNKDGDQITPDLESLMNNSQMVVGETPGLEVDDEQTAGSSPDDAKGAQDDSAQGDLDNQGGAADDKKGGADDKGAGDDKGGDDDGAADDGFKPRFEDHQAAEEGYKSQSAHVTKLTTDNTDLKKERDELKQEKDAREAGEQKIQDDKEFLDFTIAERKKAIAAINEIDEEDPDYDDKVAGFWGANDLAIKNYQPGQTAEGEAGGEGGGGNDDAGAAAAGDDAGAGGNDDLSDEDQTRADDFINTTLANANFTRKDQVLMDYVNKAPTHDPESNQELTLGEQMDWVIEKTKEHYIGSGLSGSDLKQDDPVFTGFMQKAPLTDPNTKEPLSFQNQVVWVVEQTKNFYATQKQQHLQDVDQGMGAGSKGGPGGGGDGKKTKPVEPKSLGDIMDGVQDQRRI